MAVPFDSSLTFDGTWPFDGFTLPALQYLIAFNNNAFDDPAIISSVASPPGVVGGQNVWTDITRFVDSDSGHRGRTQVLQQFEAGERTIRLRNLTGQFTPWNTGSTYYPNMNPRKPFQVRATFDGVTYTRFTGHIYSWETDWSDPVQQIVTLQVADALRVLNLADIAGGYPRQVVFDGALDYWRLNEPSGSTYITDSEQQAPINIGAKTAVPVGAGLTFGNAGAMVTDPATSAGFIATAASSPTIVTNPVNANSAGITIEYWYRSTYTGGSGTNVSWQWHSGVSLYQAVLTVETQANLVLLVTGNPSGTNHSLSYSANLGDGNWHHVVAIVIVTGGSAGHQIFVDGNLVASDLVAPPTGQGTNGNVISSSAQTPGAFVQEVALYGTPLSGAQVANHFALATLPQQSTGARIGRILNVGNWPAGPRAIDTGVSTVQAVTSSLAQTSMLSHMQQVEATETGALFITGDGKVKFLSRQTLWSNTFYTTSQVTLGDGSGDIPFTPGTRPTRDDTLLYTEASAGRQGGNTQITGNTSAIATEGRNTWNPPTTLLGVSDAEVLGLTQYVVAKFSGPIDRLPTITIDLYSLANSQPAAVAQLLSLELLYMVTVERTRMPAGCTAFVQTCNIENIQETITPTSWTLVLQCAIADPAFWILGTSKLGASSGQTTRLSF